MLGMLDRGVPHDFRAIDVIIRYTSKLLLNYIWNEADCDTKYIT